MPASDDDEMKLDTVEAYGGMSRHDAVVAADEAEPGSDREKLLREYIAEIDKGYTPRVIVDGQIGVRETTEDLRPPPMRGHKALLMNKAAKENP